MGKTTSEREGTGFLGVCSCSEHFRTGIRVEKRTSERGRRPIFSDLPLFLSVFEPGVEWENEYPKGRRPIFPDLPLFRALPSMLFFVFCVLFF